MKYFLETTKHTIEPALAKIIGLNETIFICQLNYWISKSKNKIDEKIWVFNSLEEWEKQFPYWSSRTIQRIIKNLKNKNLLITKQIDKNKMNRTNWYTINYETMNKIQQKHTSNKQKEEEKTPKKSPNEGGKIYSDAFIQFYNLFPKKYGKKLALQEFNKLNETNQKMAIKAAKQYAEYIEENEIEAKYIKHSYIWLKEELYLDVEDDVKKVNTPKKLTTADKLNQKILKILASNFDTTITIDKQKEGGELLFEKKEQKILCDLEHSIEDYQEMEFQKGEILKYLKGVLE
jgi:hypothetical protein